MYHLLSSKGFFYFLQLNNLFNDIINIFIIINYEFFYLYYPNTLLLYLSIL